MATRVEVIIQACGNKMVTKTSLDCHQDGHTNKELIAAQELQAVIFDWLENKLHATKLTQEGKIDVH